MSITPVVPAGFAPFDPDFVNLLPHTVTIAPYQGVNTRGEETYGSAITVRAYVDYNTRVIRTVKEVQVVSAASVMVPAVWLEDGVVQTITVGSDDRLTLADGTIAPILNVDVNVDEQGVHDYVIATS